MATSSHPPLLLCLHTIPLILLQSEHYLHGNRLLQPVVSIATARGLEVGGGRRRVLNHFSRAERPASIYTHVLSNILVNILKYSVCSGSDRTPRWPHVEALHLNDLNVKQLLMSACFYLQLFVLKQSHHQSPDAVHCFLVTHVGEQVIKHHYLEVREHRVASVPGAAARNLKHTTISPFSINNIPWECLSQEPLALQEPCT